MVLPPFAYSQSSNRYALVIGNNTYQNNIKPLSTPVNDATDISNHLKTLGYEVDLKLNLPINELDESIDNFILKLDSNRESEGFFWFAGHGVNVDNKHYLLSITVDPRTNNSIIRGSYSVDALIARFDSVKNKANLIVIDACRNDFVPGQRSLGGRGLAIVASESVVGNEIVYSTMAGQTADDGKPGDRNSPFAAAFINNIKTSKSFDNLFIQIVNDTRTRTNGVQRPYKIGYFTIEDYAIAPLVNSSSTISTQQATTTKRGLRVVQNKPTDMFVFYSTPSGGFAADGTGRNSPFAQAFLSNITKREPLNLLAIDIVSDTYTLTQQSQKPTYDSRIINNKTYSLAHNNGNKRYAVVIGINNYDYGLKLKNPSNDAVDVAAALTKLGYEVDLKIDINEAEMDRTLSLFIQRLSLDKTSEGFFWFAGMSVQVSDKIILMPTDTNINSEGTVRSTAFSFSAFFQQLEEIGNEINIFFLDVGRYNPFGNNTR
jgi:uncharacterized caspase-like protein